MYKRWFKKQITKRNWLILLLRLPRVHQHLSANPPHQCRQLVRLEQGHRGAEENTHRQETHEHKGPFLLGHCVPLFLLYSTVACTFCFETILHEGQDILMPHLSQNADVGSQICSNEPQGHNHRCKKNE